MTLVIVLVIAIVLLFLVGGAIVGFALQLLWWALLGLVIGALARLLVPGRQRLGWLMTILLGVAGALLGGIIADAIGVGNVIQFLIAVGVAALLVALVGGRGGRRALA